MMDRTLFRNFLIFTLLALSCFGALGYVVYNGSNDTRSNEWITHTNEILTSSEKLLMQVEGMVSSQRGFLVSGNPSFLQNYQAKKGEVSRYIADLYTLTEDNPAQATRLTEMKNYFTELSLKLEDKVSNTKPALNNARLNDVQTIDALRRNISRLHDDMVNNEYEKLNDHIVTMEMKRDQYLLTLLVGGVVCISILLLLNGFLLHAQTKRNAAERTLKESEDRFALAIEGANDGIFDWDINGGRIFYSKSFFAMLGIDRDSHIGTMDEIKNNAHPEDVARIFSYIDQYLRGEVSEYSNTYRMRHASGRWIWVNARARAMYDAGGKPYRMVGAHTDITYIKETQERLEAEKARAEKANLAKTDFLAHMSHEIRTPLTAISGIAEIFERQKNTLNEKQRQLVHTLLSSTSSLKDLVNDILDFSKIESGELTIESREYDPAETFEQLISITAAAARQKGLEYKVDYDVLKGLCLTGDPMRLRQILINLVGNAIKFTHTGGIEVVAMRLTRDDGAELMRIDVRDTGIGVPPETMEMIFQRFKQGDSSVSRKYGGTGLGLPISRNLARLMGGDIDVKSEKDKGSCFTLTLPLRAISEGSPVEVTGNLLTRKVTERMKALAGQTHRILMVEDYEGNIIVISYFLEDLGIPFDIARNGREAVDMWREHHYDAILMDVQMPEMDGFTATRKIRELERENALPHTPIIGMTAHALVGDRDKCIEAGMDAYLPKPIVEADLKSRILGYLVAKKAA